MRILLSATCAILLTVGLTGCAGLSDPIPQDMSSVSRADDSDPAVADDDSASEVTTCDRAREAFLTGTKADVRKALKALKADRTQDGTAREYAGYYIGRDAHDSSMREADQGLISMSCS